MRRDLRSTVFCSPFCIDCRRCAEVSAGGGSRRVKSSVVWLPPQVRTLKDPLYKPSPNDELGPLTAFDPVRQNLDRFVPRSSPGLFTM